MAQENAVRLHSSRSFTQQPETKLSVEEQIIRLINRDFFAPTRYVKELHEWLDEQREYKSLGIIMGQQGTGKSVGLEAYIKALKGGRKLRSIPLYALYLEVFPTWGIQDICIRILELLNHGDRKGKTKNLLLRTWEALKEFGVEILIVDHADELTRKALISLIRLSLRKETRISLILVGSTELENKLIEEDLDSYFDEDYYEFGLLYSDEFSDILLEQFAKQFLGLSNPETIFDDEVMNDLYEASWTRDIEGCNFRRLMKILTRVIAKSSKDQSSLCINKSVLKQVVNRFKRLDRELPDLLEESEDAIA